MRDFRSAIHIIGLLLCIEAIAMTIPMITDLIYKNKDWDEFLLSSLITFFIGLVLYYSFRKEKYNTKPIKKVINEDNKNSSQSEFL